MMAPFQCDSHPQTIAQTTYFLIYQYRMYKLHANMMLTNIKIKLSYVLLNNLQQQDEIVICQFKFA